MTADLFKAASVVVAFACHEWQMQLTQKITQICGREILNTFASVSSVLHLLPKSVQSRIIPLSSRLEFKIC